MSSPLRLIRGFNNTGGIYYPTGYNGKLYFTADAYNDEKEVIFNGDTKQYGAVWVTDGSEDGTRSLYDFALGESTFVPTQPFNTANNRLFFQIRIDGADEPSYGRTELWSYLDNDPSTNSEKLIKIADSLPFAYRDHRFDDKTEAINSGLFFFQRPEEGEDELWFTDGEKGANNTYSLGGSTQHPRTEFVWLEGADNLLYFIADGEESVDGSDEPRWDPNELWVTSSTPGTFQKISDFDYRPSWSVSSPIHNVTTIGDSLYFIGGEHRSSDKDYDIGPWMSVGGTQVQPFTGLTPQLLSSSNVPTISVDHFTRFKEEIYFLARVGGAEPFSENLYAYNPSSEETRFVAQTSDDWANFSSTRELFIFNDLMYFSGHSNETGWELWSTDGTNSGTGIIKDLSYREYNGEIINSGIYDSHPQGFAIHKKDRTSHTPEDDDLYFKDDKDRLWKIKAGSSSPTQVELPSIYYGVGEITSVDLANGGSDLYFTMGQSIYKLDDQETVVLEPKPELPVEPPTTELPVEPPTTELPVEPPTTELPVEPPLTGESPKLLTAILRGSQITLQFDNQLSDTLPSNGKFTVNQGNKVYQVVDTEIKASDGTVKISVEKALDPTASLLLDYLDFVGNQTQGVIESITGVDLDSFTGYRVNNQSSQNNSITIDDGEFEGKQITLFLSDPISDTIPSKKRFKVKAANKKQKIIDVSIEPEEGIITLSTKKNLDLQQSIFVSYKDLGGDQSKKVVEDLAGNDMSSIKDFEIISGGNNVTRPIVSSAILDENTLTVEFDSIIGSSKISNKRFKVKVNGKKVRVLSATIDEDDESYVDLELKPKNLRTIDIDSSVTLSYKDPKGDQTKNVVEDIFGNDLESFRGYGVEIVNF